MDIAGFRLSEPRRIRLSENVGLLWIRWDPGGEFRPGIVSKICSIYHCGAAINFIKSYSEHRSANGLGTLEIIKLSCLANCRINYISTLSVLERSTQSGYVQSKQVAECLLEQVRERGLLVSILRPGKIPSLYHYLLNFTLNFV